MGPRLRGLTRGAIEAANRLSQMDKVDQATRHVAAGDLREALRIAEQIGAMEIVEGADPHLEMGALYELSLQKPVPPVLLFRKIKGYPDDHRVVCNLRSSRVFNDGVGLELVQNYRKHRRKKCRADPVRTRQRRARCSRTS